MVGGRKRASDAADSAPTTRSAKVAKTDNSSTAAGARKGRGASKPNIGASTFKTRALPLHINITNTPPIIGDGDTSAAAEGDENQDTAETTLVSVSHQDPGFVGSATLVPTVFSTGSYGWKGTRRFVVELQGAQGDESGEKVNIILTMNATVIGSKSAKDKAEDVEHKDEEHHDEDQNGAESEHVEAEPRTEEAEVAS